MLYNITNTAKKTNHVEGEFPFPHNANWDISEGDYLVEEEPVPFVDPLTMKERVRKIFFSATVVFGALVVLIVSKLLTKM
ncbi:MAG: hypothetical protein GXO87_05440 [Chlorobi bacterium]|nr:hypothetical protein [Chlorobiota bacterium]